MTWQLQAPGETRQWEVNWTDQLSEGETIEDSDWVISPDEGPSTGALISDDLLDTAGKTVTALVSGLDGGVSYQLKNTVRTSDGRILTSEFTIRCRSHE